MHLIEITSHLFLFLYISSSSSSSSASSSFSSNSLPHKLFLSPLPPLPSFSFILDCSSSSRQEDRKNRKNSDPIYWHLPSSASFTSLDSTLLYKSLGSIVLKMRHEIGKGNPVLIHSSSSSSSHPYMLARARTIVIAYMMFTRNLSMKNAIRMMKENNKEEEWDEEMLVVSSLLMFEEDILCEESSFLSPDFIGDIDENYKNHKNYENYENEE